jgi:hypothetical protein
MELQSEFSSVDLAELRREVRKWQPIPRPENRLPRPAQRHPRQPVTPLQLKWFLAWWMRMLREQDV